MNPLSILGSAARATGLGGDSRDTMQQDDGAAQGQFAQMLGATQRADAPRPTPTPVARDAGQRRDATRGSDGDKDTHGSQDERTAGTRDADDGRRASVRQKDHGPRDASGDRQADEAGASEASGEEAGGDEATTAQADAWPPAGLGGFALMLLQGTPAAPPADASALAAGTGALPAGLAGASGAATATAATSGVIPLPGLAASATAATAAATAEATAPQALAALAAAAQAGIADAASNDSGLPDATATPFALSLPTTPALPRLADAPAVFNASPTPTPDLQGDGFDEAVGTRLSWLAEQKIGHAHIKITPNDLGPIEVQLKLDGDRIHASFSAAHADVRQALEQSLPRLRDMLGEHGFQLAHADVGAQQQGRQGDGGNAPAGFGGLADGTADEGTPVIVPASVLRARGLLDAYA